MVPPVHYLPLRCMSLQLGIVTGGGSSELPACSTGLVVRACKALHLNDVRAEKRYIEYHLVQISRSNMSPSALSDEKSTWGLTPAKSG